MMMMMMIHCSLNPCWGNVSVLPPPPPPCILLALLPWPFSHINKEESDFWWPVWKSWWWRWLWCALHDPFGPWPCILLWCAGLIRCDGYLSLKIIILIYPERCGASAGGDAASEFYFSFFLLFTLIFISIFWGKVLSLTFWSNLNRLWQRTCTQTALITNANDVGVLPLHHTMFYYQIKQKRCVQLLPELQTRRRNPPADVVKHFSLRSCLCVEKKNPKLQL